MIIKFMLIAAALTLSASAQANNQSARSNHRTHERLVDRYCDGTSCELVYERNAAARSARSPGNDQTGGRADRYVVRIVPDRSPLPVAEPRLAIGDR